MADPLGTGPKSFTREFGWPKSQIPTRLHKHISLHPFPGDLSVIFFFGHRLDINSLLLKITIEIVDFPIHSMVIFRYVTVYQRVSPLFLSESVPDQGWLTDISFPHRFVWELGTPFSQHPNRHNRGFIPKYPQFFQTYPNHISIWKMAMLSPPKKTCPDRENCVLQWPIPGHPGHSMGAQFDGDIHWEGHDISVSCRCRNGVWVCW